MIINDKDRRSDYFQSACIRGGITSVSPKGRARREVSNSDSPEAHVTAPSTASSVETEHGLRIPGDLRIV